jgi:hypothetical protein
VQYMAVHPRNLGKVILPEEVHPLVLVAEEVLQALVARTVLVAEEVLQALVARTVLVAEEVLQALVARTVLVAEEVLQKLQRPKEQEQVLPRQVPEGQAVLEGAHKIGVEFEVLDLDSSQLGQRCQPE